MSQTSDTTSHEQVASFSVGGPQGSIQLEEWSCGPKYVVVGEGSGYCPKCGDSLPR